MDRKAISLYNQQIGQQHRSCAFAGLTLRLEVFETVVYLSISSALSTDKLSTLALKCIV
jgi:hypothetical protein